MKKIVLICTVLCLLLSCAACGVTAPEPTAAPTAAPTEIQTEPHECQNVCKVCHLCNNGACTEAVCGEKCLFAYGDFITTEPVKINAGAVVFDIGENIYLPAHLEEMAATVVEAIEKNTGLKFNNTESPVGFGKVSVIANRENLYAEQDGYAGLKTSEENKCYAYTNKAVVSPSDLFLGHSPTVIHELTHVLMYRQSDWSHGAMLDEGLSTYTAYLVSTELEKTAPELACYLEPAARELVYLHIYDYDALFAQPIEYWLENTFTYAFNKNYAVGFRFMAYLHQVYGDYAQWIPKLEEKHPFYKTNEKKTSEWCIEAIKSVYGRDVFDNFYPWLQENLDQFDEGQAYSSFRDLTGVEEISWYPNFQNLESTAILGRVRYQDLLIRLEPMRKYVKDYKGFSGEDFLLVTSEPVEVILHYADGTTKTVMTNSEALQSPVEVYGSYEGLQAFQTQTVDSGLSLDGVSAIELVGEGQLDWLEIVGDFRVLF